jgi:ribosomal protein L40E
MKTYKDLFMEFEEKVKALQAQCEHKEIGEWVDLYWAPGHATNTSVRICKQCDLKVHSRFKEARCRDCEARQSSYAGQCTNCGSNELKLFTVERNNITGKEEIIDEQL